jgi:hypothetical protein
LTPVFSGRRAIHLILVRRLMRPDRRGHEQLDGTAHQAAKATSTSRMTAGAGPADPDAGRR